MKNTDGSPCSYKNETFLLPLKPAPLPSSSSLSFSVLTGGTPPHTVSRQFWDSRRDTGLFNALKMSA